MASLPKGFSKTVSTLGAVLRGIGRVDGNQRPTSFFRFAGQALPKLRPRRVVNGFGEAVIMHHAVDRQVFDSQRAVAADQPMRQLMGEVMPLEPDALMDPSNDRTRLGSLWCALVHFGQLPLRLGQGLFLLTEEARVGDLFT